MTLQTQSLAFVTLLLLVLLIKIEGNLLVHDYGINNNYNVSSSSLSKVNEAVEQQGPPPVVECRNRPFACSQGEFPPRSLCCRNRCVDVTSDTNNCGLCGIRCRSNLQCCNRLCINTNINPFNCGRCGRACPFGRLCLFGLCTFPGELPPFTEPPAAGTMPPPPPPPAVTEPPTSLPPPVTEPPTSMPDQNESESVYQSPAIME